jgi:hypothetical protein
LPSLLSIAKNMGMGKAVADQGVALLRAKRGLMHKIGRELGLSSGTVPQWKRIPPHWVLKVEQITGYPRHQLSPELYPPPDGGSA